MAEQGRADVGASADTGLEGVSSDLGADLGHGLTPADRRLPPALAERAHSFAAGSDPPVEPRAAATVALLRDGAAGVEAYLLRRVMTMAFASGMHVFPGGGVDVRDAATETAWAGPAPEEWARTLGTDVATARALVCAAVRETFEESGILLAGATAADVVADATGASWEADRAALVAHTLALSELLDQRRLVLRTDLLRVWSRWVTPEFEPRRYDTYVFLAVLPTGQRTRDVGGEADQVAWMAPGRAVDAFRAGTMPMLPPTVATLLAVAGAPSAAAALELAADRRMAPILPRPVLDTDGAYLVLPGETGYGG